MDTYDSLKRSAVMRKVKSKNTKPELQVRSMLHRMGFRFRLHRGDLPGKPDIVLPRWHAVILVQGCFWHGHAGCKDANRPASNTEYWNRKIDRNIERDRLNKARLEAMGWRVITVWTCRLADEERLSDDFRRQIQATD
jgi:DNA mismatch endonuclease (patch repair protein)